MLVGEAKSGNSQGFSQEPEPSWGIPRPRARGRVAGELSISVPPVCMPSITSTSDLSQRTTD